MISYSFGICQHLYTERVLRQFTSAGVLRNPSKEPCFAERDASTYRRLNTIFWQLFPRREVWIRLILSRSTVMSDFYLVEEWKFGGRVEIHLNNDQIDITSTRWSVTLEGQISQTIRKSTKLALYASPLDCESSRLREFVKDFRASKSFEKQCIWLYCRRLTFNCLPEFALSGCLHPLWLLCRLKTEPLRFQTRCVTCSVHLVSTALTTPLKRR